MALILCIETATEVCSVALFRDEILSGARESSVRNAHSARLSVFIDELLKSSGHSPSDLDAITVSMGPGSYTGLRIGVATAKGLCYALDKPLIAVPTLQAMAVGMKEELQNAKCKMQNAKIPALQAGGQNANLSAAMLFCPMIDARRMEVYAGVYDQAGKEIREVRAEVVDDYSFQEFLADRVVVFGGEGAEKCRPLLGHHPNACFLDGFRASALHMNGIASSKFHEQHFENLAYFEPFYLKDFVAGKPRVKGLI